MERRVEPLARAVAGEHPPGAVGAVGGRGEADDQDPRRRVAEAADRPRPVVLAAVARGGSAASASRQATSRGQRRQAWTSAASAVEPPPRAPSFIRLTIDPWHRTESRGAARRVAGACRPSRDRGGAARARRAAAAEAARRRAAAVGERRPGTATRSATPTPSPQQSADAATPRQGPRPPGSARSTPTPR